MRCFSSHWIINICTITLPKTWGWRCWLEFFTLLIFVFFLAETDLFAIHNIIRFIYLCISHNLGHNESAFIQFSKEIIKKKPCLLHIYVRSSTHGWETVANKLRGKTLWLLIAFDLTKIKYYRRFGLVTQNAHFSLSAQLFCYLAKFCALCAKQVPTKCTAFRSGLFRACCANKVDNQTVLPVQTSLPQSRNLFMIFLVIDLH